LSETACKGYSLGNILLQLIPIHYKIILDTEITTNGQTYAELHYAKCHGDIETVRTFDYFQFDLHLIQAFIRLEMIAICLKLKVKVKALVTYFCSTYRKIATSL
jgi:hypothetical protein